MQQIKRAWILLVLPVFIRRRLCANSRRIQLYTDGWQHTYEQIRNMHRHIAHDLFRNVRGPDLQWPLKPFPLSFIHECQ
jgi:hypothetical protein